MIWTRLKQRLRAGQAVTQRTSKYITILDEGIPEWEGSLKTQLQLNRLLSRLDIGGLVLPPGQAALVDFDDLVDGVAYEGTRSRGMKSLVRAPLSACDCAAI